VARRRTGRRSQRRLGTTYPSSAKRIRLALRPVSVRWYAAVSRLAAASLLVLAGWAIYAMFKSPNFYVYDAEVLGNAAVRAEEVYAISDLEGISIFWVDPEDVAGRVEKLPDVRSAHVDVRLPARVIINVEERVPEIVWQTGDGLWWVDPEGIVFPPHADLSDTLTIVDTDAQPVSPGQRLDPTIIETAQSLRRFLPNLRVMEYSRTTGISFTTGEGWPVYLGDGRNMDAKLTILVNLRQDLLARGVKPEFVDVRYVEKPFYK
jgi:cell division protein FtsQ